MKSCKGCPINITTEHGAQADSYGCLPSYSDIIKWYRETGKLWACHEKPTKVCTGFLIRAKANKESIKVNKNLPLITEQTTLAEIYDEIRYNE